MKKVSWKVSLAVAVVGIAATLACLGLAQTGASAQPGPGAGPGFQGGPGGPPPPEALFERFDKDADGKLSKTELLEMVWERMGKADTDGDGALSLKELEAARPEGPGGEGPGGPGFGMGGPGGPGGPGFGMGGPGRGRGERPAPEMLFERHDDNGDGKLTKDEVPEWAWERMVKADADADGAVTLDELKKSREEGCGDPECDGNCGAKKD